MEAIWLYQFRLIVIGDSTVGKSCLIRRFTEGRFAQVSDPTVGVDFFSRLVEIEPGKRIKLQIWDTAGQERFRSITRAYYRNSVGGLLLFDITNRRSFQNVHDWLEEARSHVQPHSIVFLLVGHKCDLEAQRQVCPAAPGPVGPGRPTSRPEASAPLLPGDPAGSGEAGGGLRDALRGDVGPRRHQRGARLHRADQGHLRPGALRRHHHPGGLGGREERLRPQRGPLLGGGDQERPPLPVLIVWKGGRRTRPEGRAFGIGGVRPSPDMGETAGTLRCRNDAGDSYLPDLNTSSSSETFSSLQKTCTANPTGR
ncbi:unnamed protein product [Tetraodon nigroviridis]|uniref:(spotted green pufferfish) hypothetical protein n=1 Tax=Tetraodon nigroviridis TaxID=99883 RepID=Q4T7K2_TETNG|nr:unnamed protein product [Tetraodon nigroviridis]